MWAYYDSLFDICFNWEIIQCNSRLTSFRLAIQTGKQIKETLVASTLKAFMTSAYCAGNSTKSSRSFSQTNILMKKCLNYWFSLWIWTEKTPSSKQQKVAIIKDLVYWKATYNRRKTHQQSNLDSYHNFIYTINNFLLLNVSMKNCKRKLVAC